MNTDQFYHDTYNEVYNATYPEPIERILERIRMEAQYLQHPTSLINLTVFADVLEAKMRVGGFLPKG